MGGADDNSTLPSPISPTSAQGSSNQPPLGALNSSSQIQPPEATVDTKTEDIPVRPRLDTAATTSTVDSFASAVSTPASARPDKPNRVPPPIPIDTSSNAPVEVPPKEDLPTPVSQANGHTSYDQPGAKSTTGRAITHNLDSPDDLQTLTPLRAHYLKKTLISLQFSKELNILTTQPSNSNISTLSYLGAPFTPLPRDVPREDVPFLRFMFRQFALTFPFLAAAPKDFFPNKLQPFIASVVARNLSSATNLLESDSEAQANDGQQMLNKAEKHLALLLGAAMKLVEDEEVVRLSQADLARIEKAAERRRRKAEAAGNKRPEVFDVNVIAVRAITDKGRVRSKVHEEFVIRTRRTGQPDVFVSRRYGDFKSLADELRKHHPMEEIRPPPPKDRSQVVVSTPTTSGFSIRSYLYGSGSTTPSTGVPTSPVPTNDSAETLGSLGSPTSASMQSQSLAREKNRLTLRGYLHGLLSHSSIIASSPVLRSFLLSGPIRLTDEERRDADRREEADRVREEGKKKFAEEIAARIEALRGAVRGVRGDMMGADGLSRIFATIKATQNVADLPADYRAVLEWARISLASTIFQQLVAADSASETLANLKRLHGLMPYFVMKGILKVSNPMAMIRGMLDLFLATPFGGKSLLQRMFTSSLSEEVRALQEDIQAVEDKVEDPILCEKIKQFINAPRDIQKLFKADAAAENLNLISVILRSETSPTLTRPQLHRVMRANRAHAEYIRQKADLSDSDEDEGPQNEDAWLFEDLTILIKLYARLRDREQLIALIFEGTTSELLKDIITIFYTPLAQVYKAASIADSLGDLQNFINDLIRTVEQIDELGQLNPHRTVQAFIDLVARHEQAFYAFVHKVHSKGEGLFDSLMKWIELFIGLMREGLGNPVSLEFILPHAGGEERAQLIREIDSVALYHYKLKLAHEDKIRKRFGRSANASSSIEDQEEAAAQEFMADLARDMQFSDVIRGDAGEITAMESESGSSEYDSDETDETDSTEESDSGSGTGTAESVGHRVPPHSAPLPGREQTKGRASLDVPSPSKPSAHSGLRHSRSFSHEHRSPAGKDPKGGRISLRSSPIPQRRRKAAQVLKEPELKLLPELLPLFVELVRATLQPRSV
ncbi:PX domain-containing protein YPR097W [Saccharomyces cerevisiae S288c] [Rhizoctonia solani]|uniref:PX domain-containing protein YPR097W [Saccharomyces cerevisiae S288c] n=1 Tax=Rhizoctonia solani TaxID=456999 RepID=A0A0K6FVB9_9AGAM|nr:PX domain-containing protein YPR097W [Saccharomyces cerevisiae S288c] [Rhizoctonia solani]